MKLSKKKFPFLYKKDVEWYFANDYRQEEIPFTSIEFNATLHEESLIRDYFSIEILHKHWDLFNEVYLFDIMQHWKHFQKHDYLIMNNEGISTLVNYDSLNEEFKIVGFKDLAVVAMFSISGLKPDQTQMDLGEYYFTNMLTATKREEFKEYTLNNFRISYAIKHFAPTEVKIVHDKKRKVNMGKGKLNQVTADSGLIVPVNIIDSSYLTTIIHVDVTSVRGHFRLQPCGKMMLDRKLIWIDPYEKGPYFRKAKKLNE